MISVLFVCLGNICRSPALEASLKQLIKEHSLEDEIFVDSAAFQPSFLGCEADKRISEAAKKRGIEIHTRAKLFEDYFFNVFDFIFAVNQELLESLKDRAESSKDKKKVHLATEFSRKYPKMDIPDPYYLRERSFELVMDMSIDASQGIFEMLQEKIKDRL